ncbi:MAG TPA: FecR domain-containing protein, partial [Rhizomicrobium sp.]|nr:FecR domain-containing protein [Rhizomicrobium sp.]
MSIRLSSREVYDQAAVWVARVDAGSLSDAELQTLDAWLDADTRHFGAYAQARALLEPMAQPCAMAQAGPRPVKRRMLLTASIAASLAVLASGAIYTAQVWRQERYSSRIGEMRVLPLSDGSVVTLNTNSEILVRYSKERREIQLVQGEALFDVAKNKQRPFIVVAGSTQVRAVGTSFTVKLLPDQPVQVVVREGVVEVKRPDVPVAPAVRVAANTRAEAPTDTPIVTEAMPPAEIGRALAWRVGRIAFHGETLDEAAAEFARYSDVRIHIDDPAVGKERITGLFVSADPVGFSKAVAVSFNLRAEISDRDIRLSR